MQRLPVLLTLLLLALSAPAAQAQNASLKVGDKAPEFTAVDDAGNAWKSADYVGDKLLVVYFYPAAMTGGCTKQACAFRDNRTKLNEMGAEVIGISGDDPAGLEVFRKANRLNFPLLSDRDGAIARAFGVPVRDGGVFKANVDGKEVELNRGVTTARWTFVIDKKGEVVYVNQEVNPERDSAEVIAAIEKMQG